ncbi:MAG: tRNA (guanosine(37)-N1)-methyltransferase TrmD [Candidatus Moranbacteria bacterium]|nr:tRNA (guanosine(37)-N1)-methyltransferase TrmD [Candidatus Moranbacteria bacterium]OIQ01690.1 MAG: tRNA (guanosine(37)-N1)-methyltransferase TrmD [Candidatus Moranbacteria bacterium CG2_30_41_165]PIP25766.1 MAG: tRNA (guanosine(37)-N1)-methyltransferase TrmD [Candidatus Moranbacteria bacterium CG23_combo_of_CG06-09_8_20_14_all_41_28]PJC00462.1 MAG: tRNA (guanosine(37)-N1)-methyltransferase TrmD [Candidatus Moranbacteria bacterium CG_4_9_14_0_8_um_filter_41_43]HCJ45720.1 tRNA (guanosine(37)-N
MHFDIISLFPESFHSYFGVSILKRAQEDGLISITTHNLRDYAHDKHKTVDDTPYGGGAGMLLKVEPLTEAIEDIVSQKRKKEGKEKSRTILFSAKGKTFTEADAKRFALYDRLILICGRYEGIDERVTEHFVDEEFSIGHYVLTGGEIPAMIVVDAVSRLIPGVLGNEESVETESHSVEGIVEYPQYTKPETFREYNVPEVLLSGNHGLIVKWREEQSQKISTERRKEETKEI